jgi:hypothetical protein
MMIIKLRLITSYFSRRLLVLVTYIKCTLAIWSSGTVPPGGVHCTDVITTLRLYEYDSLLQVS